MKINDCENCGSNELTYSVWNEGGMECSRIECDCCGKLIDFYKIDTGFAEDEENEPYYAIWS